MSPTMQVVQAFIKSFRQQKKDKQIAIGQTLYELGNVTTEFALRGTEASVAQLEAKLVALIDGLGEGPTSMEGLLSASVEHAKASRPKDWGIYDTASKRWWPKTFHSQEEADGRIKEVGIRGRHVAKLRGEVP